MDLTRSMDGQESKNVKYKCVLVLVCGLPDVTLISCDFHDYLGGLQKSWTWGQHKPHQFKGDSHCRKVRQQFQP